MLLDPDESGKKQRQKLGDKKRFLTKERNLQEKRLPSISTNILSISSAYIPPLPDDIDDDIILPDADIDDADIDDDDIDNDDIEDEMMKNVWVTFFYFSFYSSICSILK